MPIILKMVQQIVVYLYNGILFISKEKWTTEILQKQNFEWKKPEVKEVHAVLLHLYEDQ